MSTLFLHIGPGKTATTFLQNKVLAEVYSAECFTLPQVTIGSEEVGFGHLFCYAPEIWGTPEAGPLRDLIGRSKNELDSEPKKDVIISDEFIYGDVVSPQPWIPNSAWISNSGWRHGPFVHLQRRTLNIPNLSSLQVHLEKLKEISQNLGFEEMKVLFTTRRQDTKLASTYAQLSNRVRGASQEGFEEWARHLSNDRLGYYAGGGKYLDYYGYWKGISEAIGQENVFIAPFELLKENTREFLNHWLGYLEVPERNRILEVLLGSTERVNHRSTSEDTWEIRAPLKRVTLPAAKVFEALGLSSRVPIRWPDLNRQESIVLTDTLKGKILDAYRSGNESLDRLVPNIDLKKYDYY